MATNKGFKLRASDYLGQRPGWFRGYESLTEDAFDIDISTDRTWAWNKKIIKLIFSDIQKTLYINVDLDNGRPTLFGYFGIYLKYFPVWSALALDPETGEKKYVEDDKQGLEIKSAIIKYLHESYEPTDVDLEIVKREYQYVINIISRNSKTLLATLNVNNNGTVN